MSQFCVFYSNTEVLDGFETALMELLKDMKSAGFQFGSLPTVALTQGGQQFSPAIMGNTGVVPLNGLVINLDLERADFVKISRKVPYLRVEDSSELPLVSTFHDSYSFLLTIGKDSKRDRSMSIRESIRSEFERKHLRNYQDLVEEIRILPRTRRRALGYALLASLPLTRPFVFVAKWLIRKKS
jgi:hypothetical protein